jgi:diguanylate cyclase (GGDEF)-like protein
MSPLTKQNQKPAPKMQQSQSHNGFKGLVYPSPGRAVVPADSAAQSYRVWQSQFMTQRLQLGIVLVAVMVLGLAILAVGLGAFSAVPVESWEQTQGWLPKSPWVNGVAIAGSLLGLFLLKSTLDSKHLNPIFLSFAGCLVIIHEIFAPLLKLDETNIFSWVLIFWGLAILIPVRWHLHLIAQVGTLSLFIVTHSLLPHTPLELPLGQLIWQWTCIGGLANLTVYCYEHLAKEQFYARRKLVAKQRRLEAANRKLQRLTTVDGLTGIANRSKFDRNLQVEWRRLSREYGPLSVIMCDVDFFKPYNDTYGHQAGDKCLQQVAQSIHRLLKRPADLVARYGGEEFVVLLPNTPLDGALEVAEAIRQQVKSLNIPHVNSQVSSSVTLSLGVACEIPYADRPPSQLVAAADQQLYRAKQLGRDRVVSAPASLNRYPWQLQ